MIKIPMDFVKNNYGPDGAVIFTALAKRIEYPDKLVEGDFDTMNALDQLTCDLLCCDGMFSDINKIVWSDLRIPLLLVKIQDAYKELRNVVLDDK